ncbi:MAG: ComEC/Rec2 family competence protein [Ruminococcaceae bacterium]|nr:ComEC/Rec2 family competence protein [Oscillospiraceae bacterium]
MVLKHRRLLILSLITLLSVFVAEALTQSLKAIFFWVFFSLSLLLFFVSFGKRRAFLFFLAALLTAGAFLSSYQVSYRRACALSLKSKETLPLSVTVLASTGMQGDVYSAEGRAVLPLEEKHLTLRVKILSPSPVNAGDVLFGEARFSSLEEDSYAATQGFYGNVYFEECKVVDRLSAPIYTLGKLRAFLTERLCSSITGETGALLSALLLGNRDRLPSAFTRDMTRIGTTHMLSLSGMHLAVLTAGLSFLLRRLCFGRHARTLLLSLFVIAFMLVTGLSSSVMRAGFMFLLSSLPFFFREERDGLSSLVAAVAVICLFEPYAARDLSLWLSALSTLGIILFFDRKRRKERRVLSPLRRILGYVALSLSVTLSATVATLPLTLCVFGTLPLLSMPANLILAPLVQLALYLSLFVVVLGGVPVLSWVTTAVCNSIFTISSFLANIPNTVLSLGDSPVRPLVHLAFAILLFYFLLCPRKRFRFRFPLAVCLAGALTMGITVVAQHLSHRNELAITYHADRDTASDAILFRYKGEDLLSVFSDFSALSNAERSALAEVSGELDGFLLPYYTEGTEFYVEALLRTYKVYRLYLPTPKTSDEWEAYRDILKTAKNEDVPTVAFAKDKPFFFRFLTVSSIVEGRGSSSPNSVFAEFLFGYSRIGYFSANALGFSLADDARAADLLIFGAYPSQPKYSFRREDFIGQHARVLCTSPALFPFADKQSIVFSKVGKAYIPMRTAIR